MGEWVDALLALASRQANADDADGVSEVLDVLCSLLRTSTSGHWGGGEQCRQEWISDAIIGKLYVVLQYALDAMDFEEGCALVLDALTSLVSHLNITDTDSVLEALKQHQSFVSASLKLLQRSSLSSSDQWSTVFIRSVLRLVLSSPNWRNDFDSELTMLRTLSGSEDNVRRWITSTWERKWSLCPGDNVSKQLLSGSRECTDFVQRVLGGFSIPPTESPSDSFSLLASTTVSLRRARCQTGLVHGVDITFVKDGCICDYWSNLSAEGRRV